VYLILNKLDKIQHWIDRGRLDPSKEIGVKEMAKSGVAGKVSLIPREKLINLAKQHSSQKMVINTQIKILTVGR
jgi:hypothetical protein